MPTESEHDFEFAILLSWPFQKTMEKIRERTLKKRVYKCVSRLAIGFRQWRSLGAKKVDVGDSRRSIRVARVNPQMRILFEGPIETKRYGHLLFIHNVCSHNEYIRTIKRIAGGPSEREFSEIELTDEEMKQKSKGLDSNTVVFAKPIPVKVLLSPERIDAILSSTKANLLLTQRQMETLSADRPLLIHGQAGSGKTTLLCHRLALSVLGRQGQPPTRLAFLSYNEKLVKQASADTQEILRDQYGFSESLEGVDFSPFQAFLKRYVPNPSQFEASRYVPFGRFKQYYEVYRRGNPAARRIPAEVAWHGIRSILKGACIPPTRPPLSTKAYRSLARRRKDFPEDMFDDIYKIGDWYQRRIIQDKGLWDDQDLAWAALDWVLTEKNRNPKMLLYDEIFCDEGQDLTEIEFRLLVALCRPPTSGGQEGLPLVFAGDPLQTINPTGFRWSIVGKEVYRIQGEPMRLHELQENFRSDKRIVAFANQLQDFRSYYMGQPVAEQEAFEKDGDMPQIVIAETKDEISVIRQKLGELPPESAVIVWPEESDKVTQLYQTDEALSMVDRQLDLYSISEAKGLEFRLVVLYRFGSSPAVLKWKDYLVEKRRPSLVDEIPLLYFLNRLYVAVTRAKLFLIVVDTKLGIESFWSLWKETLHFLPRPDVRNLLESHPAFQGEVSDASWRRWAETLFEHADRIEDLRLYERARRAYEKAGEKQNVKWIDARVMEISERWKEAGILYSDINKFEKARRCYDKAELWDRAYEACAMLPTTPETKRYAAIYKFKIGLKQNAHKAAMEFHEYTLTDNSLDKIYLDELGDALLQIGASELAAQVFLHTARSFSDNNALIKAAESFFKANDFEDAEKFFAEAGATQRTEYQLSQAQNLLRKGDIAKAVPLFFNNDAFEKVIEICNLVEQDRRISMDAQLLRWTAESYFKLGKHGKALLRYKTLYSEYGIVDDTRVLQRIAECFEKLDEKLEAYDYYRRARLYEKATSLAQELGRPQEEILSLKTEEAWAKGDIDGAIKLAEGEEAEGLVHLLKGRRLKSRREYRSAIPEFIQGEEWSEALDCILRAQQRGDFDYGKQYAAWCSVLLAVSKSNKALTREERGQLMVVVRQIVEDPIWERHIPPADMGLIFERCATFAETALYYESRITEKWAQEGWLRVKAAHHDYCYKRREFEKARRLKEEIRHRRTTFKP